MVVSVPSAKIAYFPVPKTACTSLKHMIFQLENDRPFEVLKINGRRIDIHTLYKSVKLTPQHLKDHADSWKFTIIRDPIKRMISAYSNRVVFHRALVKVRRKDPKALGDLSDMPSMNEFFENFRAYRAACGEVQSHTRPAGYFLGRKLSVFDAVYPIEKMDQLAKDLSERVGKPVEIPRLQDGGPKLDMADLSPRSLKALLDHTARDYELFDGIYTAPPRPVGRTRKSPRPDV